MRNCKAIGILRSAYLKLLDGTCTNVQAAIEYTLHDDQTFNLSPTLNVAHRLIASLLQEKFVIKNVLDARLQYWCLEENFPHHQSILSFLLTAKDKCKNFNSIFLQYYSELKNTGALSPLGQPCFSSQDVIKIHNGYDSKLIVCYAGLARKFLGLPWNVVNEYYAKRAKANLLILKDDYRARYIYGIKSLGNGDPQKSFVEIRKIISSMCTSNDITIIGSSGGSFGAVMASQFIDCQNVVCLGGKLEILNKGDSDDGDRPIDLEIHKFMEKNPEEFSMLASKYSGINDICKPLKSLKPLNTLCRYSYLSGKYHKADNSAGQLLVETLPNAEHFQYETKKHMFMQEEFTAGNLKKILNICT